LNLLKKETENDSMDCGSHKVEVSERVTGMAHDVDVMWTYLGRVAY